MQTKYSLIYNLRLESIAQCFKTKSFLANLYGQKLLLNFIYNNHTIYMVNTTTQSIHLVKQNNYYLINNYKIIIKEINLDNNLLKIGIIL